MKIIPLSEGAFTIDKTKVFQSFDLSQDDLQARPAGSLLVEIQPFLIITSKDVILMDTGLGFEDGNGMSQLHQNLAKHAISPGDVTKVLMSHLHKDHSGGMCIKNIGSGERALAFPNARYYINRQELAYASESGSPSFHPEDFHLLIGNNNLTLIDGNGLIDDYIKYELTGAHSRFHQVFWIIEDGQKVFFGGDVAPQLQQMKSRFVAKYDFDGKRSMELRQQWWNQGVSENWIFLFYHDIKNPVVQL